VALNRLSTYSSPGVPLVLKSAQFTYSVVGFRSRRSFVYELCGMKETLDYLDIQQIQRISCSTKSNCSHTGG
jgi:hypothetical protein